MAPGSLDFDSFLVGRVFQAHLVCFLLRLRICHSPKIPMSFGVTLLLKGLKAKKSRRMDNILGSSVILHEGNFLKFVFLLI